jgi:mannose-6-phosphate isomerase-like protein (cupin superfamily)
MILLLSSDYLRRWTMIEQKYIFGFEELILREFKIDQDYSIVRHRLLPGQKFDKHFHRVDETIIVLDGSGRLIVGRDEKEIYSRPTLSTFYMHTIPAWKKHTLVPLTEITYLVIRPKSQRRRKK